VLGHWNRGYGRRGFAQYQFVIPFADGPRRLRELLTTIVSAGELPFLNVLKRMGAASGAPLSFPAEGYTFAIDFPVRARTVALLRRLDAMVVEAGGRIYLGKDSTVEAATFPRDVPAARRVARREGQVRSGGRLHVRPRAARRSRRLRALATFGRDRYQVFIDRPRTGWRRGVRAGWLYQAVCARGAGSCSKRMKKSLRYRLRPTLS